MGENKGQGGGGGEGGVGEEKINVCSITLKIGIAIQSLKIQLYHFSVETPAGMFGQCPLNTPILENCKFH